MKHKDFKIVVEGEELDNPLLRLVVLFLCGVGLGVLLASGGV